MIKFKTIQRGQPGVQGGGEKKYYLYRLATVKLQLTGLRKQ